MATQRAKAQTPTTAKLAASHAAAHKLRHQLLDLRSCPPPSRRYPLFSVHPSNSNTKLPSSNRCVAQTLTLDPSFKYIVVLEAEAVNLACGNRCGKDHTPGTRDRRTKSRERTPATRFGRSVAIRKAASRTFLPPAPQSSSPKTRGRASILPAILRNGHNRQAHILGLLLPGACRCRSRIESEYEHPSQRARKRNGHAQ